MIKIRNIYYMLAYAFQVLKQDSYIKTANEEFEHPADLLAAILAKGIANQVKRGLGRDYLSRTEPRFSPVGQVDISASIKQQTMRHKQLVCHYDLFDENTYINQVLKTTAFLLIHSAEVSPQKKKDLRKVMLYFSNVNQIEPRRIRWSNFTYNRNNVTYKMLIYICYLVIQGMLLSEQEGYRKMARYIDDQRMHQLYEKFVLEYYRKHYPELKASASQIDWDITDGVVEFLPRMQSDITLQYQDKILIIDTKYYEHTMQKNRFSDSRTLHSHNMYQIYTYVKNKDTTHSGKVSGVLLYAKTDERIVPDHHYVIGGNHICVKTLDLNSDFSKMAKQLDSLVERFLHK